MTQTMCTVEGCERPQRARSYCSSHYNEWHYYRRAPQPPAPRPTECATCACLLPPKKLNGPAQTYCSVKCRRDAQKPAQADGARRRAERRKTARPDRSCVECGAVISGTASLKRIYCSTSCSSRASRRNQTRLCTVEGCEAKHVALGLCSAHYKAKSPNAKQWKRGKPETRRANLRRKTQQRRARLRGDNEAELIDRDRIGDRDSWVCGLCHKRVDNRLNYPDPLSASLDHITPLSMGGLHVLVNVQISHLRCNVAKGNRGHGEQLLLIG